ncbi:MAG: BA14K family protein [Aestuariivirga sp.]
MRIIIAVAIITGMPLFANEAFADPAKYCEAYSKDAADLRIGAAIDASIIPATGVASEAVDTEAMRLEWMRVRDAALSDCLAQYDEGVAPKQAKKKKTAAPVKTAELKPGTAAWNSYCAAKYVSFNPDTGNYTGKSGKIRPCQVTPN